MMNTIAQDDLTISASQNVLKAEKETIDAGITKNNRDDQEVI